MTPRNPARMVKNPRSRDTADLRNEQKLPFTDAELRRMYEACETKYGKQDVAWTRVTGDRRIDVSYVRHNHVWTGQDVADFISVSVYTDLRISDVCLFHIDRMEADGAIRLRTTKAGTHVCTWVPEWLQERIRARALTIGPNIFGKHQTKTLDVITELWRRRLNKLWSLCGPWKETPTPHRFRHTFARILLERPGVTVRDGGIARQHGADCQEALRRVDTRTAREANRRPQSCLRHEAKAQRHRHAEKRAGVREKRRK